MRRLHNTMAISMAIFLIALGSSGCSCRASREKQDTIAYVNKDPIYRSDLASSLALRSRLDPSLEINSQTEAEQLNLIINTKLITQEAMERGLARQERFINTIKAFWEQTLIRDFVDYKKKEFERYLFASPSEIKKYYENLSYKATFRVLAAPERAALEVPYRTYKENMNFSNWQEVGPLGYEDLPSGVFFAAFDMQKGDAGIFSDQNGYYLIAVAEKSRTDIEPLENLKPEIERRIIAAKERKFFEDWLENKRKNSDIKIITK